MGNALRSSMASAARRSSRSPAAARLRNTERTSRSRRWGACNDASAASLSRARSPWSPSSATALARTDASTTISVGPARSGDQQPRLEALPCPRTALRRGPGPPGLWAWQQCRSAWQGDTPGGTCRLARRDGEVLHGWSLEHCEPATSSCLHFISRLHAFCKQKAGRSYRSWSSSRLQR